MGAAPQEQVVTLRPAALGSSSTCRARLCATLRRCIAGSVRQQQKRAALSKATAFWGRSALASSFRCWTEGVAEVQRQRAACAIIESAWAAHQQRQRFTAVLGERTAAALLAQRRWRGRQARQQFVATQAAVCLAQRRWRGLTARRHARQLLAQQQARQAAARQQAEAACVIQRAFRVLLARQQLKALAEQRARAAAAALVLQRHARRWLARQQLARLSTAATTVGQCQAEAQLDRSAPGGSAGHLLTEQLQAAAGSADHAAAQPGSEAAANTKDSPLAEALAVGIQSHPSAEDTGAAVGSAAGMAAQTGAEAGSTRCSALATSQPSYSGPAAVAEPPSAATGSGAFRAAQSHICADFQVAGSSGTPVKPASAAAVSDHWGSALNSASADAVATSTLLGMQSAADCSPDSTQPGSPMPGNSSHGTSGFLGAAAARAGASLAGKGSAAEQHNPQPAARAAQGSALKAAGSAEAADTSGAAAAELQHSCRPSIARIGMQR